MKRNHGRLTHRISASNDAGATPQLGHRLGLDTFFNGLLIALIVLIVFDGAAGAAVAAFPQPLEAMAAAHPVPAGLALSLRSAVCVRRAVI